MSDLNMILLILAVVFGVAYFAKRSHRKQKEMKMRAKQRQA
jgi:preprotein translocase subunit YajC